MKKSLLSILLAAFLAVISGCADDTKNTGTSGGSSNIESIPAGDEIKLEKHQNNYAWAYADLTNPRKEQGTYYPILISNLMGLYNYNTLLTSTYKVDNSDGDLTLGNKNYDIDGATSLNNSGTTRYHLAFTDGSIPTKGTIVIAFLTKEEENKFFNIELVDGKLPQSLIDELNQLGALRQYKWATDTGTGGGSSNPGGLPAENIPVDETTVYKFAKEYSRVYNIALTNPRKNVSETVYPVLISQALGLEGGETDLAQIGYPEYGIIKGVKYQTSFASQSYLSQSKTPDLTFCKYPSESVINLTSTNGFTNSEERKTYYILFDEWNDPVMPSEGYLLFAFLTAEEIQKYFPSKDIIDPFAKKYLDSSVINALNNLGALKQYKWTAE